MAYDEATAILVGDALLTLAFEVAVLPIALLGGAALTAEAHANPNVPRTKDELETLRDRSRALTITGGTLTVLGAGSVGVSFSGTLQ